MPRPPNAQKAAIQKAEADKQTGDASEEAATSTATATDALQDKGAAWEVVQLQASRSQPILGMHRLAAQNPVWIVTASKENT